MNPPKKDTCPVTYALALFGDRWTLRVLQCVLLDGQRSFGEIQNALPGIASNMLSDRIKRLHAHGFLHRAVDPSDGRQRLYVATEKAVGLLPLLVELIVWAERSDPAAASMGLANRYEIDRDRLLRELADRARFLAKIGLGEGDTPN